MPLFAYQHSKSIFEQDTSYGVPFGVVFILVAIAVFIVRSLKAQEPTESAPPLQPAPQPLSAAQREGQIWLQKRRAAERDQTGKELLEMINDTAEVTDRHPTDIAKVLLNEVGMPVKVADGKLHLTNRELDLLKPHLPRFQLYCDNLKEAQRERAS